MDPCFVTARPNYYNTPMVYGKIPPDEKLRTWKEYSRGQITTDEGCLSYLVRNSSGPWLILVPGSWCDNEEWTTVVNKLDPEISLALVDLRGHGDNSLPPSNGSVEQFAHDVITVTKTLNLTRFFIGGHSIGGMVALEVGRQHPDYISGVISIEGWTVYRAEQTAFNGLKYNTLSSNQMTEIIDMETRVTRGWTELEKENFRQIWRKWNGYDFLYETNLPILELWGDRGLSKQPKLINLSIPERENIQVHWLIGASHYLPLERPNEVAQKITNFIETTLRK